MAIIPLKVQKRDTGKQIAKRHRKEGNVPGVFYYKGEVSIPILTDTLSLRPVVYTKTTKIINLEIEGVEGTRECILRDVDFDPITDRIVHFDLMGFKRGQKMLVEVPIIIRGQSVGEKAGGLVSHTIRKVKVYCLPKDLPESIELDISELNIGDSVSLNDAGIENVDYDISPDTVVCSIVPPRVLTAAEEEAEAEAEAEAEGTAEETQEEE